jgi:hypothetical protein
MQAEIKRSMEDMKIIGEEKLTCHETMEARLQGEPASVDRTPEVAQEREIQREDAVEIPVGEPRKRRRDQRRNLAAVLRQKKKDQNLDARRHKKEQKWTLRKNGCRRNLFCCPQRDDPSCESGTTQRK